jgi:hypothetical protein
MNARDIIQKVGRQRFPDWDEKTLKPALIDFIEACMLEGEVSGEFAELVREMRHNQRKFFENRGRNYLDKSKELEALVDLRISPPKKSPYTQGGLF